MVGCVAGLLCYWLVVLVASYVAWLTWSAVLLVGCGAGFLRCCLTVLMVGCVSG